MRPRSLVLPLLLLAAACAPQAPTTPTTAPSVAERRGDWPEDTVLAVEDLPITATEVDAASVWVERIDRKASPDHLRRLALTNVVLPARVARLLEPEGHARALAEARDALARLRQGTWVGPPGPDGALGRRQAGTFQLLGIVVWGVANDLPDDEWSEPLELAGRVVLVRRLGRTPAPVPLAVELDVDLLEFPYLDPATAAADVEAAYDRFRLTLVDPDWRTLVPELLQYRMGVHGS
jgi:hypothetical protein